jgi:hypothetical protein
VELEHYGLKMANKVGPNGLKSVMFGGWKYETGLWTQPGFPERLRIVRDAYAAND